MISNIRKGEGNVINPYLIGGIILAIVILILVWPNIALGKLVTGNLDDAFELRDEYIEKNIGGPVSTFTNGDSGSLSGEDKTYIEQKSSQCKKTTVAQLEPEFIIESKKVASEIGSSYEDFMRSMSFETGGTFCACQKSGASNAVGLIQFMPKTAQNIGTTSKELCDMTRTQQLSYVLKYFNSVRGSKKLDSLENIYMAIFWPAAIGKGSDYQLELSKAQYDANKGLDINKDGKVTVAEATTKVKSATAGIIIV